MDQEELTPLLCGEESFGTSSDHIREKDGLWAVLAWLSVLAHANPDPSQPIHGVEHILTAHWQTYGAPSPHPNLFEPPTLHSKSRKASATAWVAAGRHYYARYDYEGVPQHEGKAVLSTLTHATGPDADPASWAHLIATAAEHGAEIDRQRSGMWSYHDHTDGSTAANQGVQLFVTVTLDGGGKADCRAVFRLSGTAVGGATLRMYLERFAPPPAEGADAAPESGAGGALDLHPRRALQPVAAAAVAIAQLTEFLGRTEPDLVT